MIKRKNGVNPLKYIIIVVIIVGIAVFFSEHYEETNDNYNAEEVTQINKELSSVFSEDYNNQTIEEKKEICKNKLDELAEKYFKLFTSLSGMDISLIQRWIPIIAATQLEKYSGEEEKFLRTWINVAEY